MFLSSAPRRCARWGFALLTAMAWIAVGSPVAAQVCNVKVVTDANPDYHDIGSMIHSITSGWQSDREKCWALFYWAHIARRQTSPMIRHGTAVTDPIRQFNDYGQMMCSTISGANCAVWGAMGYEVKYWDITAHTVSEVKYDGRWHMYDNSMTAMYTLCDGVTVAGVEDIGATRGCEASGGKHEPGHIARYHCLNATSPNGFLTGADYGGRTLESQYRCFHPNGLKYRWYYHDWDLGHRYILNLRDGEVYTRHYRRLDADSPDAVAQGDRTDYVADPAYFVPNKGRDPDAQNPRYRLRGNGVRTLVPRLDGCLDEASHDRSGVQSTPDGVRPSAAGVTGEIVFKLEGANVITSTQIDAAFALGSTADRAAIAISTNNGRTWQHVWTTRQSGDTAAALNLVDEVNGSYEVLVKVTLSAAADPVGAVLTHIAFQTITMLNSKTQPQLKLGRNTVYVGAGDPSESIVIWPELQGDAYKPYVVHEKNVRTSERHIGYQGAMFAERAGEPAYVIFAVDAPRDISKVTYGGRFYNRARDSQINLMHSFDGGATWKETYALTETRPPWDIIHYGCDDDVPADTRHVLFKYAWNSSAAGPGACSIYAVRMEVNHQAAVPGFRPVEVTFTWNEPQDDGSHVTRSHTQLVEQSGQTYVLNVGGADHPQVESLQVNLRGVAGERPYGYSDGRDAGGQRFQPRWRTVGTVLSVGKPYTCSVPSGTNWGAGDPDGTKLTDGVVGSSYTGGATYRYGALWSQGQQPEITVDLGESQACGAFRIHVFGYPGWDAGRGEVRDEVEVFTSQDGEDFTRRGEFDMRVRWKDLPANHQWNDEETFRGHNFELILPQPVSARYVRFRMTPRRMAMVVSEVQVLDHIRYEPFDLRIALPDGHDRSDITRYLPAHTPSQPR